MLLCWFPVLKLRLCKLDSASKLGSSSPNATFLNEKCGSIKKALCVWRDSPIRSPSFWLSENRPLDPLRTRVVVWKGSFIKFHLEESIGIIRRVSNSFGLMHGWRSCSLGKALLCSRTFGDTLKGPWTWFPEFLSNAGEYVQATLQIDVAMGLNKGPKEGDIFN